MARARTDRRTARRPAGEAVIGQFTVLFVCTGNVCRSALAERLASAYLDEALGAGAPQVRVISAGTGAVVGSAMHEDSALVLRGFGGERGDSRAQQLDERIAAQADLTLTMTREHRRAVLEIAPRALARTFTLREAAELLQLIADDAANGDDLPERARALVAQLASARSRRQSGKGDDIADPIGQPVAAHQQAGEAIAGALV